MLQELLQLEDRLGSVSRGAMQNTIERFTFPHKYKKVSSPKPQHGCQLPVAGQGSRAWKGQKEGLWWVAILRVGKLAAPTEIFPEMDHEIQNWCFNILWDSWFDAVV